MITVEETILKNIPNEYRDLDKTMFTGKQMKEQMVIFAKLHVQKALKQAYENIEYSYENSSERYVKENSILNAYNIEENIK